MESRALFFNADICRMITAKCIPFARNSLVKSGYAADDKFWTKLQNQGVTMGNSMFLCTADGQAMERLTTAKASLPTDVTPILDERERMAERLRGLGLEPRASHANFLYVPVGDPEAEYDRLLQHGLAVRTVRGGIRITIRTQQDDDRLLQALA